MHIFKYYSKYLATFIVIIIINFQGLPCIAANGSETHPPEQWVSGTLPVMYVVTQDSTPITSKQYYLDGVYWIDNMGLDGFESIGSAGQPLPLQIKGRGNTSWTNVQKKPYRIKLAKKAPLLGMKSDKHWCLMAYVGGSLMMLEEMASELGRRIGLDWSPDIRPVELVVNGDYLGLYCIVEKIRVDKDRVNITEQADNETNPELVTGGWLMEIDNTNEAADKQIRFTDRTDGSPLRFTWHSPEVLSDVQRDYITKLVTTVDSLIYVEDKSSTEWEQYIDIEALARFYVVCELMDNVESFSGSCYWHKDIGKDSKIIFGPVWDQGSGFGHWRQGYTGFIYNDIPAYSHMHWIGEIAKFTHFQQVVRKIWKEVKAKKIADLDEFFDAKFNKIAGAAASDNLRWIDYGYGLSNVERRIAYFKNVVAKRVTWLDKQWSVPVAVEDIIAPRVNTTDDNAWYDMQGHKITSRPTQPGIYIHSGQKVIVK